MREEEPNHPTARKPGPLCVIQYSPGKEVAVIAGGNGVEFGVKEDDSKKRGPLPLYSFSVRADSHFFAMS